MKLEGVLPWGRSFEEYRLMFSLSENDLKSFILGCGDGPASFNAELTARGGKIISADPLYQFSPAEVSSRIDKSYDQIMAQVKNHTDKYIWGNIDSIETLGKIRTAAMKDFLSDYPPGLKEGRYINAALPDLPFSSFQFDLALCSHFLFLYSEHIDLAQHLAYMTELCRVSREVRVYPLLTLDGKLSPHLRPVSEVLVESGMEVQLASVEYQFQKGAVEMLVVKNSV